MQSKLISEVFNFMNKDKHNAIWQNLLAVRRIMATQNKSLTEAVRDLERIRGEVIDLNLDAIKVYYSLYSLVCFKEDHEADIDFSYLETNKDYRGLKNEFDASHNNISFLANLRNFITHNTLKISTDGVEIYHPVNANGKPTRERFERYIINSIVENLVTGLLKKGTMYKLGDPVKEFKDKKGIMIYCPMGKASDIMDANNPDNFLIYDRTAAIFAYYKLNEEMLANPDMKFNDLLEKLLNEDRGGENSAFLKAEFKMMQNIKHLLANDVIQYASFVFSSDFYNEKLDYSSMQVNVDGVNGENIEKIRHALMHGYYSIDDEKITIKKLDKQGEDELIKFRKKNKQRKHSPDHVIQEFIKNNRTFDNMLENVCSISCDELVTICNDVIDFCKELHPKEYGIENDEPIEEKNQARTEQLAENNDEIELDEKDKDGIERV